MRRTVLFALAIAVLIPTVATGVARAGGGRHPHFDDRGTLEWYHTLAQAKAAAKREGKLIFVEFGRLRCSQCRVLCSHVLPDPRVRSRISALAVGLAADCDAPERIVDQMFTRNLRSARMLPFVAFLTPDGEWISGYAGGTSVDSFLGRLRQAEARRPAKPRPPCQPCEAPKRIAARPRPAPAPATRPCVPEKPCVPETPCVPDAGPVAQTPAAPVAPMPPPSPVRRAPTPVRSAPAPLLTGDPDAVSAPPPSGCAYALQRARQAGPLPAPRIVISRPVLVRREARGGRATSSASRPVSRPPPSRLGRARQAAARDAWRDVLAEAEAAPDDPALLGLLYRANQWANDRLDEAVQATSERRYEDAVANVESVLDQMEGQPAAVDARRGLAVIRRALELDCLDPRGPVAPVLRKDAAEDYRGTRWAKVFE